MTTKEPVALGALVQIAHNAVLSILVAFGVVDLSGEQTAMAVTCVLPAQIELPAGAYRVRVSWKDRERMLEAVAVEAGGTRRSGPSTSRRRATDGERGGKG